MTDWRAVNAEWARVVERYALERLKDVRRLRARCTGPHNAHDVDHLVRARATLDLWIVRARRAREDSR